MTKIKKLKEETLNLTTEHAFITLYFKQRHWDNLSITKEEFEVKINQVFKGVKIKLKSEFELHDRLLFSPNQLIILGNSFDNKNNTHITDFPIRYITEILKY